MAKLTLYLVHETTQARRYRKKDDSEQWVPKSVCSQTLKHPPAQSPPATFGESGSQRGALMSNAMLPMHEVEIADWWLEKNPWPKPQAELKLSS